jgi:uronate dehydrogenase
MDGKVFREPQGRRVSETILLTGAAGSVAQILRPALAEAGYLVRLSDRTSIPSPLRPNEHQFICRIENSGDMMRACEGVSALVHLAAAAKDVGWPELTQCNVVGLTTVMEAARAQRLSRVVFASTMHVLGMHERVQPIDESSPVAPDSRYAASKVFGEGVCRLFSEKYGIPVTVLRIGHVTTDISRATPGQGVSDGDLSRIFLVALSIRAPGYRLLHAVAPHEGYPLTDGRLERDYGFHYLDKGPDRSDIFARIATMKWLGELGRKHHGGIFAQEDGIADDRNGS